MEVTVVTNVEMGRNCVVSVYESDEYAKMTHKGESYVFTSKSIDTHQTGPDNSTEDRIKDPDLKYDMALKHQEVLKSSRGYAHDTVWSDQFKYYFYASHNMYFY